jgi:UDP-galactopyranose mutase
MMMTYDFLIVGAGFAGATAAERLASVYNKRVLVIDKRPHVAGNAFDELNEHGVRVHRYGPHIFHTNSEKVFRYLSRFTEWRDYEHRVLSSVNGQLLPMPINLDTINRFLGAQMTEPEVMAYLATVAEPRDAILTSEDVVVSQVGRDIYEAFFRNYTRKQWGLDPSELDASVIARVPIRTNHDDRYFTDTYQVMPVGGYTALFERMLTHPNITVLLDTSYDDVRHSVSHERMIYTGPIDEFFDYRCGPLEYRSLDFRTETTRGALVQPVAVINSPNEHAWTRVTEFKHLTGQQHPMTSRMFEFPTASGDPYYPVPRAVNRERYDEYRQLAETRDDVVFTGRLGTYKYYNMDQVTAQSLALCERLMHGQVRWRARGLENA